MNSNIRQEAKPDEPKRMGARVLDAHGDTWKRGRTRWTCEAEVDGSRIQRVARMGWSDMLREYGPVRVIDLNDRA